MDEFNIIETERIEYAAVKLAAEKAIILKYCIDGNTHYIIEDINSSHLYAKYYVNGITMFLYRRLSFNVFIPVSYNISKRSFSNNLVEAVECALKVFKLCSIGEFC